MVPSSRILIRDTITRLEALAEILRADAEGAIAALEPGDRAGKEIGLSIRVLLPKLRSFGSIADAPEFPVGRVCAACGD